MGMTFDVCERRSIHAFVKMRNRQDAKVDLGEDSENLLACKAL